MKKDRHFIYQSLLDIWNTIGFFLKYIGLDFLNKEVSISLMLKKYRAIFFKISLNYQMWNNKGKYKIKWKLYATKIISEVVNQTYAMRIKKIKYQLKR
jgi:hypothetical protein